MIILCFVAVVLFFIFQSGPSSCFAVSTTGPCIFVYIAIGLGAAAGILVITWLSLVFCGKVYWFCSHK